MHIASTLDLLDSVVGDRALDWSADHCIAAATSKSVILYELNPLADPGASSPSFRVQVLKAAKVIDYDTGVRKMIETYDDLRIIQSKTAAAPNFEVYQTHLDPSLMQLSDGPHSGDSGYRAVGFSPLNCAASGGTILATLATCHRLKVYSRTSDGTSIQWSDMLDLSDKLVDILLRNDCYYPGIEFPSLSTNAQRVWEKQYAAYMTCFAWQKHVTSHDGGKFILFATGTKNNFVLFWRFELPICKNCKVSLLKAVKTTVTSIKCMAWMEETSADSGSLAIGGTDGTITCFKVDLVTGDVISQNCVWAEKDELSVTSITWEKNNSENGGTRLVASKGCIVLYLHLSVNLQLLTSKHLKGAHILPITNLVATGENEWITSSQDGCTLRVWLRLMSSAGDADFELCSEILEKSSIVPSSLFPQTTHFAVVSPNNAFLAKISSKPKVHATVQVENTGFMEVKLLQNGMAAFNTLMSRKEWCAENTHPQLDLLESLRLHLIQKEVERAEADITSLQTALTDFVKSNDPHLQIKWFILKMMSPQVLPLPSYGKVLIELEKRIVAKRMFKVLKAWSDLSEGKSRSPPVRAMLKWLRDSKNVLSEKESEFLTQAEKSSKFVACEDELCSVTREKLMMSDDGLQACAAQSGVRWPRCCLTFCPLQEYRSRKCVLSDSRALLPVQTDEEYMRTLLEDESIFSACSMI